MQVDAAAGGKPIAVEFVWTLPALPNDARFFLEVATLRSAGQSAGQTTGQSAGAPPRDVVWQAVDASAAVIALPATPAHYAWRVFVASPANGHYLGSSWSRFVTGPTSGAPAPA